MPLTSTSPCQSESGLSLTRVASNPRGSRGCKNRRRDEVTFRKEYGRKVGSATSESVCGEKRDSPQPRVEGGGTRGSLGESQPEEEGIPRLMCRRPTVPADAPVRPPVVDVLPRLLSGGRTRVDDDDDNDPSRGVCAETGGRVTGHWSGLTECLVLDLRRERPPNSTQPPRVSPTSERGHPGSERTDFCTSWIGSSPVPGPSPVPGHTRETVRSETGAS